jgi:hypothetical protein
MRFEALDHNMCGETLQSYHLPALTLPPLLDACRRTQYPECPRYISGRSILSETSTVIILSVVNNMFNNVHVGDE